MNLEKVSCGANIPEEFNVIVEIPAHSSPIKYEMDKDSGILFVDRFVGTGMSYPANYGFIPHTLAEDGDPTDVLVVTPFPVAHGSLIKCRPLGMLRMEDESGIDTKILAVPTKKICPLYDKIDVMENLPSLIIDQIKFFFENYKGLEPGRWAKVTGWDDIAAAKKDILDAIDRYNKA